jgi:hypothetical protein
MEPDVAPETSAWEVHAEVQLPRFMWFVADFNEQARVSRFDVAMRLACQDTWAGKKVLRTCQITDAALSAAPLPGDEVWLDRILPELDAKLTGSTLAVGFRADGRIASVALTDLRVSSRVHPRIRAMEENLRLVVSRAVAGWDLARPKASDRELGAWAQSDSWITLAPAAVGTMGGIEMVHAVRKDPPPAGLQAGSIRVETAAKAMIAPASGSDSAPDVFETRVQATATLDRAGAVTERRWLAVGIPTPSSAIADGPAGIPYVQAGVLRRISPDESVDVGRSAVLPVGSAPTALQNRAGALGESP